MADRIDIEKHRALGRAATPRPWRRGPGSEDVSVDRTPNGCQGFCLACFGTGTHNDDRNFIVETANDHDAMLDELEALRAVAEAALELTEEQSRHGAIGYPSLRATLRAALDRWRNGGGDA
jgi:hypothetical protein